MPDPIPTRDIFLSSAPEVLLASYSPYARRYWYGTDDIHKIIKDTDTKYRRVDLVTWDPEPYAFYDHVQDKYITAQDVMEGDYSPLALQRLDERLVLSLGRWGNKAPECKALHDHIQRLLHKIASAEEVVV